MPRGALVPVIYWLCFFGLALWALTNGLPQYTAPFLGQENNPEQHTTAKQTDKNKNQSAPQSPALRINSQGEKPVETEWKKPNCKNPKSHDEADLCQQIRVADAAEYTLGVGIFTLLGLALTI